MIQGYYSAATAMRTALENQDILSQNLAHAPVPGYRRQGLTFESYAASTDPTGSPPASPPLHGARTSQSYSNFASGIFEHTGNPLEVAIQGDGFFVLKGPNGPLYTRNGQFLRSDDGQLVSHSGYPVQGSGGGLRIPPNTATVHIAQDGTVTADGQPVGRLRVASFANTSQLTRAGTTLFEAPAGATPQTSSALVRQGYREGSNVSVIHEMVQMISGMRQYDAAAKALRSLSDAMQQRINGQM